VIDVLEDRFQSYGDTTALVFRDRSVTYRWLADQWTHYDDFLEDAHVPTGTVAAVVGDFTPAAVALSLALLKRSCIFVPLATGNSQQHGEFCDVAEVEHVFEIDPQDDGVTVRPTGSLAAHPLLRSLKESRHPGLVLFSSGSTGKSKAALHDFSLLLEKFRTPRPRHTMISFLLFDHIGGINTLLSSLATGGTLVITEDRRPDSVAALVERHKVDTLPTTPTFLNLLLLTEAHRRFDLSSLTTITYGTEVMPESTLRRIREVFPDARLHQTYGLSELGIMRSKSESSDSLWVQLGGEGFEIRVVDSLLEIRAKSAMLGYLNAPSPFTEDGWFQTGDAVEVRGPYLKILGRTSDIINVGGEKVYPAEVESTLQLMPEVAGAVVMGEKNALLGNIVKAKVRLAQPLDVAEFRRRMREFCRDRLQPFKIPQKVELIEHEEWNERFKKVRKDEQLT
jgi:acyl-CoA synthetase (AMP-forming)/AMP-acid ligase II